MRRVHPHCQRSVLHVRLPAWSLLLVVVVGAQGGCAAQKWAELRENSRNPFLGYVHTWGQSEQEPSERTMLVLRRYDLLDDYRRAPTELCVKLRDRFNQEPAPDTLYALAELAYLGGKRAEALMQSKKTLELYSAAVMHSYLFLFDERFALYQNSYDPHFRGACEVYNGALEGLLRIVQKRNKLLPGETTIVQGANQTMEVTVACQGSGWRSEDFAGFKFVSDYEVTGLRNHYHAYGLGVPLIAERKVDAKRDGPDQYYPPGLSFPVTAFLRIEPSKSPAENHHTATLELHDPLAIDALSVTHRPVPLESDLTTPLAYFLSQPQLQKLDIATIGVLNPDKVKPLQGVYMLEPYRPDRIPVLMVHGLWSSPITWMEMFNDLRGSPELRDRYQFWFYLYPTGQPFWYSAAQLRADLVSLRDNLDPYHQQPTLDNLVLVGHSMGGLISKLQTLDSREDFWRTVSDQSFQLVNASLDERQSLEKTFFFRPNPSVRRVITIATPHRGSNASNNTTQYLGNKLIELPKMMVKSQMRLKRDNPGCFLPQNPIDVSTSIESLAPNSKFLNVMLESEANPAVKYHNIVGKISRKGFTGRIASSINDGDSDGVVAVASAHLENVESEITVNADHSKVHAHALTVLEVRRILLEHLSSQQGPPPNPLERLPWTAENKPAGPPCRRRARGRVRFAGQAARMGVARRQSAPGNEFQSWRAKTRHAPAGNAPAVHGDRGGVLDSRR